MKNFYITEFQVNHKEIHGQLYMTVIKGRVFAARIILPKTFAELPTSILKEIRKVVRYLHVNIIRTFRLL